VVTGIYLAVWERPTVSVAYSDMEELRSKVTVGMWVRRFHFVLAIPAAIAPLAVAAGRLAGQMHRQSVAAAVAFCIALLTAATGQLLPWTQVALWAATNNTSMLGLESPFGDSVTFTLLGGTQITTEQLQSLIILHTVALPGMLALAALIYLALRSADHGTKRDSEHDN